MVRAQITCPVLLDYNSGAVPAQQHRLKADHEFLLEQLAELNSIFENWLGKGPRQWPAHERRKVRIWMAEHRLHMGSHFKIEEKTLFPHLSRQMPHLAPVLLQLKAEHDQIRVMSMMTEAIFKSLVSERQESKKANEFSALAIRMMHLIEEHVQHEDRLLSTMSPRPHPLSKLLTELWAPSVNPLPQR